MRSGLGSCLSERRGVALPLVLWVIVVVSAICTGVVVSTRLNTSVAANYRARVVARYAAESGAAAAVATLEAGAQLGDTTARRDYLNDLDRALGGSRQGSLGDARFAVGLIDVGSRLDVNSADIASLTQLFAFFADAIQAESAARAIRAFVGGDVTGRPLQSLDEMQRIPGVPRPLAERAVGFLTVDGDGTINRATASDTVLAAAGGELRDAPSRILVVSRGWLDGHPLTHEIQAVYAVGERELILVRWRERDL
ncbi:MAG: hypothetical protein FJ207_12235 [Gemmatimonadetes bacterium]|nr:hypothetical protein [Gemmatimonadota bacterium]